MPTNSQLIADVIVKTKSLDAAMIPTHGTTQWHEAARRRALTTVDSALGALLNADLQSLTYGRPPFLATEVLSAVLLLLDTNREDDGTNDASWIEGQKLLRAEAPPSDQRVRQQ